MKNHEGSHMKHLYILGASASLLLGTSVVAKETSTDLLVTGSIAPGGACVVAIGGTVNLGTVKPDREHPEKPTALDEQSVPVVVGCPQPRRFAFVVREAGGQNSSSETAFAMRADVGNKSPGNLFLLFDTQSTKIDGVQGYATGADRMNGLEEATWGPATPFREDLPITNGRYAVGFVKEADSVDAPENIKSLSVKLIVRPVIKPANDLDLTTNIAFSSDLGLEISYF
jgi:hypothetical protein